MVSRDGTPIIRNSPPVPGDLGGSNPWTPASWKHLCVQPFGEDAVATPLFMLRFYYSGVLLSKMDLRTMGLPEDTSTLCVTRDEALRIGYACERWMAERDGQPVPKRSKK